MGLVVCCIWVGSIGKDLLVELLGENFEHIAWWKMVVLALVYVLVAQFGLV